MIDQRMECPSDTEIAEMKKKLTLTQEQKKAWAAFERAYSRCKNSGVQFYCVTATIMAVNGNNVIRIHDQYNERDLDLNVNSGFMPSIHDESFDSWADDTHYAEVK